MGFFDFLKTDNDERDEEWNFLISVEQVHQMMDKSENKNQVLFKHSPSCAVSYFAKRSLNSEEILNSDKFDFQTVDVINQRSLSRMIAELLEVRHESPQIMVIKNRKVVWHGSHNAVNTYNLLNHINSDQNVT